MSNPTTNYICKNGSGIYEDLSDIFQPLNGGTQALVTGFDVSGNDLNTYFLAVTSGGPYIDFSTNFIAKNGQDLRSIFAAITPFRITSGNPAVSYSNGQYLITITNDTSFYFLKSLTKMTYFIVGGGGAGGNSESISGSFGVVNYLGGGGGGGGQVRSWNAFAVDATNTLTFSIGTGGTDTTNASRTALTLIKLSGNISYQDTASQGSNGNDAIKNINRSVFKGGGGGISPNTGTIYQSNGSDYNSGTGGGGGGGGGQELPGSDAVNKAGGAAGAGSTPTIFGSNSISYGVGGKGGNGGNWPFPINNGTYGNGGDGGNGSGGGNGGNGGNGIAFLLFKYP
jgi:hypothetical protein